MYKTIVTKYLSETKYGLWSIISILEYTKSKCRIYVDTINNLKSDIYASLRSYRENENHVNVNNKLDKVLTDFEKLFSTTAVKEFIDKLREEQEQRGFDTAFDINVTSACTVKALEGYHINQTRIDELKNNEPEDGGTSSRFSFRKRTKINYAEPSSPSKEETESDDEKDEEQKRKKRVRFHEEKPKGKLSSEIRGNILPNGTEIAKPTPLDLTPSDSSDDEPSVSEDEDDDNDDIPDPDSVLDSFPNNLQKWRLPSGKSAEDIFTTNVSRNSKTCKQKKKLTAVERAAMRYGASRIIDLSAHMRAWFSPADRVFMAENHKELLKIPELPEEVNTFISEVEKLVHQDKPDAAFKLCTEKCRNSSINSCITKISKIYSDFIYKTIDADDMLECDSIGHTEIDIIIKAFSYIVDGLNKGLGIRQKWGESFCPLSKSASYAKGRKCDVRFLSSSGMDLGEWEFAVRATADKTISDRCRSGRINQSILNGLLRLDWNDERAKSIKVPFMQFAGVSGQMLIEDLVNGFYVIFPGKKFQLPTKLAQIEKLKSTVKITKYVMDMYRKTSNLINTLEVGNHTFDDIFKVDEADTSMSAHYKSCICDPWWTPKNRSKNKGS